MRPIAKIRVRKFKEQQGRCYYCALPMWETDEERLRLQKFAGKGGVWHLRSTAEHLQARCDGGQDTASNIVAACAFCNNYRHRALKPLAPPDFVRRVRDRVAKGKWHGLSTALQACDHRVITCV